MKHPAIRKLEKLQKKYTEMKVERKLLRNQKKEVNKELKERVQEQKDYTEALFIAQYVANQTQKELEYKVANIVSLALESVFEDPYNFHVQFDIKYGKSEARLLLERDGNYISPKEASGGGVVDIVSIALRLAMHTLNRKASSNIFILDEPFRFIEKPLQKEVASLLDLLCTKLGVQLIMITHEPVLAENVCNLINIGTKKWKKSFLNS